MLGRAMVEPCGSSCWARRCCIVASTVVTPVLLKKCNVLEEAGATEGVNRVRQVLQTNGENRFSSNNLPKTH